MADIFISHSSKDKDIANYICAQLEKAGYKCWIAPRDIVAGSDWAASIARAIYESSVLLLIYSKNSAASSQVPKELGLAEKKTHLLCPIKLMMWSLKDHLNTILQVHTG